MNMHLSRAMSPGILTVGTEDTVEKVDHVMAASKLSAITVTDARGAIFGIITTRDLLNFYGEKKNPKSARAWECCTHRVVTTNPEAPLVEVAKLMLDNSIMHVPIVENGKFYGLVSALDCLWHSVLCSGTESCTVRSIVTQQIEGVSKHRIKPNNVRWLS